MYLPTDPLYSRSLWNGESTLPRVGLGNGAALTSGVLYLQFFTALKTEYCNNVVLRTGTTAAAGTTLCQAALFAMDYTRTLPGAGYVNSYPTELGDLHLLTNTANDTALLSAANTKYIKSLAAPFYKERGVKYGIGVLWIGTGGPSLMGFSVLNSAMAGDILSQDPIQAITVTGQTQIVNRLSYAAKQLWSGTAQGVTNGTTTVTLNQGPASIGPTNCFTPDDVGLIITGTDIPANTTITTWNGFLSATLSAAATGSHTGIQFTIPAAPFSTTTQPRLNYLEVTP